MQMKHKQYNHLILFFSAFSKSMLIDQITVMLTGDNNSTIIMTGGTGGNPELFSVTLVLQNIKE